MQDRARHLLFGATSALQEGRGLLAELYGMQLEACLDAEAAGADAAAQAAASAAASLRFECSDLLARADACDDAAQERCVEG
jgi:hypothetical protein